MKRSLHPIPGAIEGVHYFRDRGRIIPIVRGGDGPLSPAQTAEAEARYLADCLNPAKSEKLSGDQILLLLRWGHDIGVHSGMQFIAQEAGYEITPVTPEGERDRLADAILEGARTLERALKQAERLPSLRAVG